MSQRRITGYSFGEFARCHECVGWMMVSSFTPSGRDREPLQVEEVERLLDDKAKAVGIDREDEASFDEASDFPKRIYRGDDRMCESCGITLSS